MTPGREHAEAAVDEAVAGMRVDRFLAEELELFPRSQIAHRDVSVRVNGEPAKLSRRLQAGDHLLVDYSAPEPPQIRPEPVPLDVIFENGDVVVINKPAGMVVHPAAGNWSGTLVQGLMHHVDALAERFGDCSRPGIVHRLDKDTSGIIIAARHPDALGVLAAQFKEHRARKRYLAIVKGQLPHSSGTVDAAIARDPRNRKRFAVSAHGGKAAVTRYRVLKHFRRHSFVLLEPETGRTHQLRVHMAHLGAPILGDPVYSRPDPAVRDAAMALHAYQLTITLPGRESASTFTAPLPEAFKATLREVAARPAERSASPGQS